MKKLLLLIGLLIPFSIYALEYPFTNSKNVEIYDLNDKKVLYEIDSTEVVSIASLTKIATSITAIENIDNLDEEVVITVGMLRTVDPEASVAGLRAGDRLTYRDLLYASMLPSGADATNSIAILTSGNIDDFVEKMNNLAYRLDLKNTHFVNVTGLDEEGHYSSADDVRKLLEYALQNDLFRKIYTTKQYEMSNGKIVKSTLFKYGADDDTQNKILGSKSGFTNDAGYCLSTLSNINGHEMITIVLNAQKSNGRYNNIQDTITLINFLIDNYKETTLIEKGKLIKILPVKLSKIEEYEIKLDKDIVKYLPSDYDIDNLKIEYEGLEKLSYKNKKGDKIGTVSYYFEDELLYKQDIILNQKIELDFIKFIKAYYYIIIPIILMLYLIIRFSIKKSKSGKQS